MGYTYYGDLLGVSGYYQQTPGLAYARLNDFYNITFEHLSAHCDHHHASVWMLSDSLLIWGDDERRVLPILLELYLRLSTSGLMLRGSIVNGCLEIDPRLTVDNFRKMLPKNDTLARAVGLEKSYKGARLLVENSLAVELLAENEEWLTLDGYIRDPNTNPIADEWLRRICPTPDNGTYEMLYFSLGSELHS